MGDIISHKLKKRSIGIVLRALDLGGAEKQSLILAKLLRPYYNVFFFLQKHKPCLEQHVNYAKAEELELVFLSGGIINRLIQLKHYKRLYKIELFIGYLTIDNVLCTMASAWSKAKYVGGIRSSYLPVGKLLFNRIAQNYFLDKMVYNNYYGLNILVSKGYNPDKACVIHNCIEDVMNPFKRDEKDRISILSVGRFNTLKDYGTAIKAYGILISVLRPEKEVEFVIIGDGEQEAEVRSMIAESRLTNVKIVNNPGNLDDYYRSADIYFLSSKIEGLPNTIMEAMSYSLPVVSTRVGDVEYLVQDQISGLLAEKNDAMALAQHLRTLIDDREMRIKMGFEGNTVLKKNFSAGAFLQKNLELINELIQTNQ